MRRVPPSALLLLAGLSLFWGLNWPVMKIVLGELSPWWFRAASVLAGGIILLSLSALSGDRWWLRRSEIGPVFTCGVFAILGWMVFSALGVANMAAGRAAIIAFTMPLWATLIAALFLGEPLSARKIVGSLIGVAGLAVLIGPDIVALQRAPLGALYMLLAALSWAIGTVLFKHRRWDLPVHSNVAWQMLGSAAVIAAIAAALEPVPDWRALGAPALWGLVYIFLFPMAFCQWAYYRVVGLIPASLAATGTLMVPVVGVYTSHLMLGEPVGPRELIALGLILAALVLVLLLPTLDRGRRRS